MTERERWIVYPLLFLALGAALRDKLVDRTTTKSIVCQELTIVDEEPLAGRPAHVLARIGRSEQKSGRSPVASLAISGDLLVDGLINANQYAYHGVTFVPAFPVLRGGAIPEMLRTPQQPGQRRQKAGTPKSEPDKPLPKQPAVENQKTSQDAATSAPASEPSDAAK